jgi:hypothetical protein
LGLRSLAELGASAAKKWGAGKERLPSRLRG